MGRGTFRDVLEQFGQIDQRQGLNQGRNALMHRSAWQQVVKCIPFNSLDNRGFWQRERRQEFCDRHTGRHQPAELALWVAEGGGYRMVTINPEGTALGARSGSGMGWFSGEIFAERLAPRHGCP